MKKVIFVFGLIVMAGIVSAHYDYTDNLDRHPVGDYRNGYSYRATLDYAEGVASRERVGVVSLEKRDYDRVREYDDLWVRRDFGSGAKMMYYEYMPYMRSYEERTCYVTPPKDRLFYVRC